MSDTLVYEEEFYTFKPNFNWAYIDDHSWWWDKGFVVFAMLCKLVHPNFFFFVFVNTLIDIILFCLCLKKYKVNIPIAILAFLAFQGILTEINTMRNIKAILLFIYSLSYIKNRQLVRFLLINIIGFTFHSSAILFLPMYWILAPKYSMWIILPTLGIFTIIYLANINILQDYLMSMMFSADTAMINKFTHYLNNSEEATLSLGFLERILTLILCLFLYTKQSKNNSISIILLNSYFIFYILYAIFGFNFVFRDRIPYLFIYAYWFIYPFLWNYYGAKGKVIKWAFLVLFFGKIYLSTNMCSAYYETVLFHETTRSQRQHFCDVLAE